MSDGPYRLPFKIGLFDLPLGRSACILGSIASYRARQRKRAADSQARGIAGWGE
jgi:hypothetical protein